MTSAPPKSLLSLSMTLETQQLLMKCAPLKSSDPKDVLSLYRYFQCMNLTKVTEMFRQQLGQVQAELNGTFPVLLAMTCVQVLLIVFGIAGNMFLLIAAARCRALNKQRICFVINLAVSDLILCVFTQPFNIIRLMQRYGSWDWGVPLCKLVSSLTGVNLFASTFSVVAIALDRMQLTLRPSNQPLSPLKIGLSVTAIWLISCLLASPLLFFAGVVEDTVRWDRKHYLCGEDYLHHGQWLKTAKLLYSAATILVQYLVPLVIISFAYVSVYCRLRRRPVSLQQHRQHQLQQSPLTTSSVQQHWTAEQRHLRRTKRRRQFRTNCLLGAIAIGFALAWLPLTMSNLVQDYQDWSRQQPVAASGPMRPKSMKSPATSRDSDGGSNNSGGGGMSIGVSAVFHSLCLTLILMSTCMNAVIYGLFNSKLKGQYTDLLCRCFGRTSGGQGGPGAPARTAQVAKKPAKRKSASTVDAQCQQQPLRRRKSWQQSANSVDLQWTAFLKAEELALHSDCARPLMSPTHPLGQQLEQPIDDGKEDA